MRFKEDWKHLGYNNPKMKNLNKIMSDEEALDFFNKLMHKYITLKKVNLWKESDKFVSGFQAAVEFFEEDWNTWIYRTLPSKCKNMKLSYKNALHYINVRMIEDTNLQTLYHLIGMLDDFYEYLQENPKKGRAFLMKLGTACYKNYMKDQEAKNS